MNINIKLLNENAKVPTRGSKYAAGYDLYSATTEDTDIAPHSTVKIGTGISVELPDNTFGAIFARSGLATKKGLRPANCVGVCDSDYRGEYVVPIHNDTDELMTISAGERIAQLIVIPYIPVEFNVVEELNETERGDSGFGSTGTN
jgi:dUTP pyrophosphatase